MGRIRDMFTSREVAPIEDAFSIENRSMDELERSIEEAADEVKAHLRPTFFEGAKQQVKLVLQNMESRKKSLEEDIARLQEDLRQTNVSINAFNAADKVYAADAVASQRAVNDPRGVADPEKLARIREAARIS